MLAAPVIKVFHHDIIIKGRRLIYIVLQCTRLQESCVTYIPPYNIKYDSNLIKETNHSSGNELVQ